MCVAKTAKTDVPTNTVEFFKCNEVIASLKLDESASKDMTIKGFENIFLVTTNNFIVALAETKVGKTSGSSNNGDLTANLVAEYIKKKEGEKLVSKFANKNSENWNMQLVVNGSDEGQNKEMFLNKKSSAVVTKDDKIFFFVVKDIPTNDNNDITLFIKSFKFALVTGQVTTGDTDEHDKTINWEIKDNTESVSVEEVTKKIADHLKNKISIETPIEASAFLAGTKKNIVFVVKGKSKESNSKNITLLFQLDESEKKNLNLFHVEAAEHCDHSVFPWEDKIIIITTGCAAGNSLKIKELKDMKELQKNSGIFSRLLDSLQDKTSFITTTINTKSFLFFTQKKQESENIVTYLWISDGTRMTLA